VAQGCRDDYSVFTPSMSAVRSIHNVFGLWENDESAG
jgi:hypothetical protein